MSDLRRAVEAEADAFAPDRVPPFDAIMARKHRRDRRTRTGGALAIAGLAATAVVLVPLSWGPGDDLLPTADQPTAPSPAAGLAERSLAALRPLPEGRDLPDLIDGSRQEGVLRGDRASECLWLETDGGEQVPIVVYVGEGIYVDFSVSPFEITDGRGGYSVAEGTAVRLTGGYQPDETGVQGCPVQGAPFAGAFLVESGFGSEAVQDGFRNTGAGYKEQSGDGPLRMVGSFENIGAPARTATFVVELKEEDGTVVWTGRATVEDIDTGETVLARYESAEPLPDGSQYVVWRVEDIVR